MNPIDTYQYHSLLENDAIRLLELQPSPNLNDEIECSMVCTTLRAWDEDLVEHYTALSYVWGDASLKRRILVDGKAFTITINLDTALRYMRDLKRKRLVWADAICS
ncbi:hypothetical protein G7Y89_g1964 [Cudoniella acicularis]|uniref:Heterokaryon incompatibility domain-containing protein n=1 Tax=Cudoniella acicularis TaxID=354080 RepID=A0A8H4RVC3_9HELO|nr:hypothetical protein G7Y89_g1964 [Cudoniella acicularis]